MALITLTNKDDPANGDPPYVSFGNEVHARNGDDLVLALGQGSSLFGENGDDGLAALALTSLGLLSGGNYLSGGNGEDFLRSSIDNATEGQLLVDNVNIMDGGNGKDFFVSTGIYATGAFGTGADMTGGNGKDTFWLRTSSDVLSFTHPGGGAGDPLADGEVLLGVFDIIRDYQAGELVDIGTTTVDPDGPAIGGVDLMFHSHVVLDEGTYAFLQGDLVADGAFVLSDEGADTLLLYDFDPGVYNPGDPTGEESPYPSGERWFEYGGSVVFAGVADPSIINIGVSDYFLVG